MEIFNWYVYVVWVPLLFWVALFFWFKRFANPIFLKKMVRRGRKWAIVPDYVTKNPAKIRTLLLERFVLVVITVFVSACSVVWCMAKLNVAHPVYGFASSAVFFILAYVLYHLAMGQVTSIYQSAYFFEYRRVCYEVERKGALHNESDATNRTIWSFTKKLKNAERHRRLWKYVNLMAVSKKIPPNLYAETMYGSL